MPDQLEILKLVSRRLEAAGIPYMLTGLLALSYYAEPRFTRDIDFVIHVGPEKAGVLSSLFAGDFYADDEAIVRAIVRLGMVNIIHLDTLMKVDLIIRKGTPHYVEEFESRRSVVIDGTPTWIVSPEDLVVAKLDWIRQGGSAVHKQDILALVASNSGLDYTYIDAAIRELGLQDIWKDVVG